MVLAVLVVLVIVELWYQSFVFFKVSFSKAGGVWWSWVVVVVSVVLAMAF